MSTRLCVFQKLLYKVIGIDLSKQQALYSNPKAIQQINFTGHLDQADQTVMYFIIEGVKKTVLDSSQATVKVLQIYFAII